MIQPIQPINTVTKKTLRETLDHRHPKIIKRFLSKIKKDGQCIIWTGNTDSYGYGLMRIGKGREKAHRLSFKIHNGEIPKNMCVCHACDNPLCVNPLHLWLGTQSENLKDMKSKGRASGFKGKGESRYQSRLKENDILQIKGLSFEGLNRSSIARIFGVAPGTISAVVRNKTWTHVK